MNDKTLESIFMILDDAREAGKLTQEELNDAMLLLGSDIPQVDQPTRDHVALLYVQGVLVNIYGPMTDPDVEQFMRDSMVNWQSDRGSVKMFKRELTNPALGNASSVTPSTPLDADTIEAVERW